MSSGCVSFFMKMGVVKEQFYHISTTVVFLSLILNCSPIGNHKVVAVDSTLAPNSPT